MSTLKEEVARFRQWAERRRQPDYSGPSWHFDSEWECDYLDWQNLYAAVESFLVSASDRLLTRAEADMLLYTLARDNEDEHVLELLELHPGIALQLARDALIDPDSDARWQAAVLLGRMRSSEALTLLQQYVEDSEEYVRRRARLAMQRPDP